MKKLLYKGIEFDDFQLYNGETNDYGDYNSNSLDGFDSVNVYVCPHCIKKHELYADCGVFKEEIEKEIEETEYNGITFGNHHQDLACGVKGCYNKNSYDCMFSTEECQLVENEEEKKTKRQYAVKITETLEKVVYIEADSRIEAEAMAEENWNNSEYILDVENFVCARFKATESEE